MLDKNEKLIIYNSDCMDIFKSMQDKSVDCTITDIPYGEVNRKSNGLRNLDKKGADVITFDLTAFISDVCRVTNGSIYIFCGTEQVSTIRKLLVEKGCTTRLCIWEKTNPSPMNGDKVWLSGIECCVFGKFKRATFNEHCKNTVFRYPTIRSKIHPTEKPVKLLKYLIEVSTNKGDTVFDPCMGSGSTGVAALEVDRKFIEIEINKDYYNAAESRLKSVKTYF